MPRWSTVMVCPVGLRDAANQLLNDLEGTGPNALQRPLYDGAGEITHYGFRGSTELDYRPLIAGILGSTNWASHGLTVPQAAAILSGGGLSVEPDGQRSPREHFDEVCAAFDVSANPPE